MLVCASLAYAGNPQFTACSDVVTGDTVTLTGTENGLGNETQVHIVLTALAECINPGGHHPKAVNKESFTAEGLFPVQNGHADFTLGVTAVFQPSCSPPMSVEFTSVQACDVEHGVCCALQ